MNPSSNINLIKSDTQNLESLIPIQNLYRNFSIIVLFIVVVAGLLTISGYIIFGIRGQALVNQKSSLLTRLEAQKTKETLFLAARSRLKIVKEVLDTSRKKSVFLTNAQSVADAPVLGTVTEDVSGRVSMTYKVLSIEDAIGLNDRILDLYEAGMIDDVNLLGLSISQDYSISLSYDYKPVWK